MADEEKKKDEERKSPLTKIVAAVFSAIIAPLTVAVSLRLLGTTTSQPTVPPPPPAPPPAKEIAEVDSGGPKKAGKRQENKKAEKPKAVAADDNVIHLFNGKDLANFYTWLGPPNKGQKPLGRNIDPEKVFTVQNKLLHVSGKYLGGLTTEKEYENYRLIVQYKWGERTWPPRENRSRMSGILLHANGMDGGIGGNWMPSIRCFLMEGNTGSLFVLTGENFKPSLTAPAVSQPAEESKATHDRFLYKPGAPQVTLTSGRLYWNGHDSAWKDVKGNRAPSDVERPHGEWNTLECQCERDRLTVVLNGKVINAATKVQPAKGRIMIQSDCAEILFQQIDLMPLKK